MRYIITWNNGYWKIFDRQEFKDVAIFDTKRDALDVYNAP